MNGLGVADLPPIVQGEHGGERERWSVWCVYEGAISGTVQNQAIELIHTPAAFMQYHPKDEYLLLLEALGPMDEAIAGAIISLKAIQAIIANPLRKVEMISLRDVEKKLDEGENHRVFDITQSIKAALTKNS